MIPRRLMASGFPGSALSAFLYSISAAENAPSSKCFKAASSERSFFASRVQLGCVMVKNRAAANGNAWSLAIFMGT